VPKWVKRNVKDFVADYFMESKMQGILIPQVEI